MRTSAVLFAVLACSAALVAAFFAPSAIAADSPAVAAEPAKGEAVWWESPGVVPLDAKGATLEKVEVEVQAKAAGPVVVTTKYTLANPTRRKVRVRAALPIEYRTTVDYLGEERTVRVSLDDVKLTVGLPPVAIPQSDLERVELPADGPLGAAKAVAFTFEIPDYSATFLTVHHELSWTGVDPPRLFPTEKGFSLGFLGLDDWGKGREAVTVSVVGQPPLLGPATFGAPAPYRYDSKGLHWKRERNAEGRVEVPERFTVVVVADQVDRKFAGPYFARFAVPAGDEYPWNHRFFHARPVTTKEDGKRVIRLDHITALIQKLDQIEQLILARNGKRFDDTFVQMRFQKESWYKPNPTFTEDVIKPVEKWNLDYVRCQGRAARTVQSALEKMKDEEIPAKGRRFKLLNKAFDRCDDTYWSPKPSRKARPKLLQ